MSSTMKVSQKIKGRLEKTRNYPREPLEDVVKRLLEHYAWDITLTDQEVKDVQEGLDDIKNGRVYTTEQLNKELGL